MLSFVSVVLGIISILQNVSTAQSRAEKVRLLTKAAGEISVLYDHLDDAKKTHDAFERLVTETLEATIRELKRYNDSISEMTDSMERFFKNEQNIFSVRELQELDDQNTDEIPDIIPVKKQIVVITETRKELVSGYNSYNSSLEELKDMVEEGNLGGSFHRKVSELESQARRTLIAADRVILNSVPVLKFFHYELHEGMGGLA
ncbi:hypothetical protein [Ruegeria arenilitoris]|uniref:hypothetical protein n=1 Tax=Ruegeria arenilitoris TaxID=1173585 RepID=UPI00147BD225|nr:hypothetical protein [Ruegeria arenilitoris]